MEHILLGREMQRVRQCLTDRVVIGPLNSSSQAVAAANAKSNSPWLDVPGRAGGLGLVFSTVSDIQPVKQPSFFDNIKSSLALPLFTATLKKALPVPTTLASLTRQGTPAPSHTQPSTALQDTGCSRSLATASVVAQQQALL